MIVKCTVVFFWFRINIYIATFIIVQSPTFPQFVLHVHLYGFLTINIRLFTETSA